MHKIGLMGVLLLLAACGNNTASVANEEAVPAVDSYEGFDRLFAEKSLPYELSDTALLNNKDTAQIRLTRFLDFVPDSVQTKLFGAKAKVRYTPMGRFSTKKENYYLVKGQSGKERAALLAVAEGGQFKALVPFLVPDDNSKTTQVSVLDKNLSVSRSTTQKEENDLLAEGKDVFAYSGASGRFELIMTDPLNDEGIELINPIDTLARTHKLAGDYTRDKKNIVSVRDGRKPGLLTVFIHIEKKNSNCSGEIKGDVQIISPTRAMYRQAGDPCVLNIEFSKNSVTLKEEEGCGSRRGIECSFDGTFTRKKEKDTKKPAQKKART